MKSIIFFITFLLLKTMKLYEFIEDISLKFLVLSISLDNLKYFLIDNLRFEITFKYIYIWDTESW